MAMAPVRGRPHGDAAAELSALVLPPAAWGALDRKRLLVVAPGALQYVPFAALRVSGEPLLARFELVSAPSASVVAGLRREPRRPSPHTVAAFADPVFDLDDPRVPGAARSSGRAPEKQAAAVSALRSAGRGSLTRLPFSRREAAAVRDLAPPGTALYATGFDANRPALIEAALSDYRMLHLATHGILNTRQPDLSGIVLSLVDGAGRPQDGFLRLHDIYNLRLNAELVVLSACQTALGKEMRGEGLIGLTRGFMYAGATAVVASLWQVDDESTSELMKRFYRGMLKENRRPADALRAAQLELSRDKRWSAPFHWAGFVLQGDWR
jgi:CHAT domain-containing protein